VIIVVTKFVGVNGPARHSRSDTFCFALGDIDGCFEWLDKAVEEKDPRLPNMMRSPFTDSLRDDPRFNAILAKMGLEP